MTSWDSWKYSAMPCVLAFSTHARLVFTRRTPMRKLRLAQIKNVCVRNASRQPSIDPSGWSSQRRLRRMACPQDAILTQNGRHNKPAPSKTGGPQAQPSRLRPLHPEISCFQQNERTQEQELTVNNMTMQSCSIGGLQPFASSTMRFLAIVYLLAMGLLRRVPQCLRLFYLHKIRLRPQSSGGRRSSDRAAFYTGSRSVTLDPSGSANQQ
jgi:hypothetical protein